MSQVVAVLSVEPRWFVRIGMKSGAHGALAVLLALKILPFRALFRVSLSE